MTTNERSKTWDKEKVRSFLTGAKQEQIQMLKSLRANPEEEELQKFYELLQHCAQEQKEEKQMKIEEFKKITKIEEEFLGVKEEFRELEDSIIIMDQEGSDLHFTLFQIKSLFRIFVFYELILQLFKHGTLLIEILIIF